MPDIDFTQVAALAHMGKDIAEVSHRGKVVWAKPTASTPSQFYLNKAPINILNATIVSLSPNGAVIDFATSGRSHVSWGTGITTESANLDFAVTYNSNVQAYLRYSTASDLNHPGVTTDIGGSPTTSGGMARTIRNNPFTARAYFGIVVTNGNGGRVTLSDVVLRNTDGSI